MILTGWVEVRVNNIATALRVQGRNHSNLLSFNDFVTLKVPDFVSLRIQKRTKLALRVRLIWL
jgi:hypothetical protein